MTEDRVEERVLELTDALLAAARAPRPDLDHVATLLEQRGQALTDLEAHPPAPAERDARRALLQRVLAADGEIRAGFAERHARVRDVLRILVARNRPPDRHESRYVDQAV